MFLTHTELADLTDCKRSKGQQDWLDRNGFRGLYLIGERGRIKVLRDVVLARMGGSILKAQDAQPNWDALNG